MNKILKFNDYEKSLCMIEDFVNRLIDEGIHESGRQEEFDEPMEPSEEEFDEPSGDSKDNSIIDKIAEQLQADLKFNYSLITTFGTGIAAMYPIVLQILKNSNLSISLNTENIVLLTITVISMAYLEEKKNPKGDILTDCEKCSATGIETTEEGEQDCLNCQGTGKQQSVVTSTDIDTLKAECKLRGLGNGTAWASDGRASILKKLLMCITSIVNFFKTVFRHAGHIIGSLIDLFAYTALLIPTMNAITSIVDIHNLNLDNLPMQIAKNLLVFGTGVGSLLLRRGYDWIKNKIDIFFKSRKEKSHRFKNLDLGNQLVDIKPKLDDGEEVINEQ